MTGILLASIGVVGAIIGVGGLLQYQASQARARTWREGAKAVGMTEVVEEKAFLGFFKGLKGRVGDLRVHIEDYGSSRQVSGARVLIAGLGHASPWESPSRVPLPGLASEGSPSRFHLRAEGVGSTLARAWGDRELETGDARFDEVAYIQGSPPTVLAILDAETRRLLMGLLQGEVATGGPAPADVLKARVAVVDGTLQADLSEQPIQPAVGRLPGAVSELIEVARRLTSPDDIPERLARNVLEDPVPGVRLANLVALTRFDLDEDVIREVLRAACRDDDAEVRLRAALALGEEAWDVLMENALGPVDPPVPLFRDAAADSRAARAVKALGAFLTTSEAGEILRRSLDGSRLDAAQAAIDVLGRAGGDDAIPALCLALGSDDGDITCAAARALGVAGGEAAETALIAALEREAPLVRRAASTALGRCGSAAAVKPLLAVDGPHNLGAVARQAVAEIQSRLTGATPGQLALADGDAGQLSLAEDGLEGQVSLAGEPEDSTEGETQWPTDAQGGETGDDTSERTDEPPAGSPSRPAGPRETE